MDRCLLLWRDPTTQEPTVQAVAAIDCVQKIGNKRLKFHMNAGRVESNGAPVDNNLRGLFQQLDSRRYELIFHPWSNHEEFIEVASQMDIAMQISFSETFNIVGADQVTQGVAFVGCDEVPWYTQGPVSFNDAQDIRDRLLDAYENPVRNVKINQYDLTKYVEASERTWPVIHGSGALRCCLRRNRTLSTKGPNIWS